MPFQIIRNDITHTRADALVISANPQPIYAGATDTAAYRAAGAEELLAERQKIGAIARGEAAVTPAFRLPAKYVIHTVAPWWEGGKSGEIETLAQCYRNSLQLALQLDCKSIAFPLLAAGVYDFPKDRALQVAMATIQEFLLEHEMQVILVVYDKKAFQLSGQVVDHVREYVDANYVDEEELYHRTRRDERRGFIENLYPNRRMREECESESIASEMPKLATLSSMVEPSHHVNLSNIFENMEKTFQEKLFEIIDERGLTGPQVYKDYISKQVYSKIQADPDYHPNKYTALALCLSLNLDVEQTLDLIGRAGWTLSPSSKMDVVVKACIINHEYNIVKINCILFDYDLPEMERIK